jgi:DNA repair protein RadC
MLAPIIEKTGTPLSKLIVASDTRSRIAALALARATSLALLARSASVTAERRREILESARHSESYVSAFNALAVQFKLSVLPIDTQLLNAAAVAIATHLMRGELEQARELEHRALADEAEDEILAHEIPNVTSINLWRKRPFGACAA